MQITIKKTGIGDGVKGRIGESLQHHCLRFSDSPVPRFIFTPRVREIQRGYKAKRKLSTIAKQLEIHPARL